MTMTKSITTETSNRKKEYVKHVIRIYDSNNNGYHYIRRGDHYHFRWNEHFGMMVMLLLLLLLLLDISSAYYCTQQPKDINKNIIITTRRRRIATTMSTIFPKCTTLLYSYKSKESDLITTTEQQSTSTTNHIQWDVLEQKLSKCTSGTQARSLLEDSILSSASSTSSSVLYKSIRVPNNQLSSKGLSDGELALQTRSINSKYSVMDVIDTTGTNDIDRTSIGITISFVLSTVLAIGLNENPILLAGPDIIRFLIVWICVFTPLLLVGYGIVRDANTIQSLFASIQQYIDPSYRQRIIHHEAGHFLMGYLLGWPIEQYNVGSTSLPAVQFYPIIDPDMGSYYAQRLGFDRKSNSRIQDEVEEINSEIRRRQEEKANAPYFSEDGRGSDIIKQQSVLQRTNSPSQESKNSKYDEMTKISSLYRYRNNVNNNINGSSSSTAAVNEIMDIITMISVAGICSEILAMGNSYGGRTDLQQVKEILQLLYSTTTTTTSTSQPSAMFLSSSSSSSSSNVEENTKSGNSNKMSDKEIDNRIRYSIGYTMSVLRRHLIQLDALVVVMEQNGSIVQCIKAIEEASLSTTATASSALITIDENYEKDRRQKLRSQSILYQLQQVFGIKSNEKTIDTIEDRYVVGKGGGGKKEVYRLTGDDPFYAAIFVSFIFLLWSISGGITLH